MEVLHFSLVVRIDLHNNILILSVIEWQTNHVHIRVRRYNQTLGASCLLHMSPLVSVSSELFLRVGSGCRTPVLSTYHAVSCRSP